MNATAPPDLSPTASLRARLERLAGDPRVRLLPEGPAIVQTVRQHLALVEDLERRVAALESLAARAFPPAPLDFHEQP